MTPSLRRRSPFAVAVGMLALVLATVPTLAQQPPPGGGSGAAGSGAAPDVHPLVLDLQRMVGEGTGMLFIMGSFADSPPPPGPPGRGPKELPPQVCGGLPALMTISSRSNGACFPNVTTTLSCSCITDLATMDKWEIRVTTPPARTNDAPPPPPTLPPSAVLGISSILVFTLPSTLVSFSLIAETKEPLSIKVQSKPGPGQTSTPSLVSVPLTNELKSLEIVNLDFSKLQFKPGFLPTAVETLSLHQCKIKALSENFLNEFTDLKALDVSMNALDELYENADSSPARNRLSTLNLSGNALTEFPSRLLTFKQLKSLDLTGNPFTDLSVSNATADALAALTVFKLSAPSPNVTCATGTWREIQEARVCVPIVSTSGKLVSLDEKGDTPSVIFYIAIAGSVVIVVVIIVFVWKRFSWRSSATTKDALESIFESTEAFDESQPTVNASLVNDPIIITNRIPYNDLRLANCISKGGFGLVYSGVYNRRRVAIKKIRPDRAGDIKMIEAFLREICLMATLHHPHIVEFVGVSWDTLRNLCAVTEFMDRGDLREVLQSFKTRNTPLTWDHHKTMVSLHIADALTYLHSLSPKVIHRDLKSKNVLLDSEMTAKLSDFGISRERNIEETHMTAGIGTSFWIAPEVLLGKDYDERADIFSFGVVLSEIDTDDYPYWNEKNPRAGGEQQQNAILQLVASGMLRPTFSESCPPRILQLADKCLQVEPEDRPTAAEIVYELQRFISSLPPMSQGFSTSSDLRY